MNIFNILLKLFKKKIITTGALPDDRDASEKMKDYLHEEVAGGFEPIVWEERPMKSKYFYKRNQYQTLSCVMGGAVILLEFYDGVIVSASDGYGRRSNYPLGGMSFPDLFRIMREGIALESTVPSNQRTEAEINKIQPVTSQILNERKMFKAGKSFMVSNIKDMDTLASIIKHMPVPSFWFFDENGMEWWKERPAPFFNFSGQFDPRVTRHQATFVDAILKNGQKTLIVQDTAGVGTGKGEDYNLREITQEMLDKRVYAVGYILDDEDEKLQPLPIYRRPVYDVIGQVKLGDTSEDVKKLQAVLIYEKVLKIKEPTGWFGGLTRKAVIDLQNKYKDEILTPLGLKGGTGFVGKSTTNWLLQNYR